MAFIQCGCLQFSTAEGAFLLIEKEGGLLLIIFYREEPKDVAGFDINIPTNERAIDRECARCIPYNGDKIMIRCGLPLAVLEETSVLT
jgi:hypothetical protein